jgi:hypothetical protein
LGITFSEVPKLENDEDTKKTDADPKARENRKSDKQCNGESRGI